MANPYFQFKQFIIHQDKCAMKVCTDACIFGAWFAQKEINAKQILDIGAGTGLLMLMLAQKQDSEIDGIEIDKNCFQQLEENIKKSEWKKRLDIHQGDVRTFESGKQYGFIISNPPFHENSLISPLASANLARHSSHLNLDELLICIDRNLCANGSFALLLPFYRSDTFEVLAEEKKFHLVEKLLVRQSPNHNYFRSILHYSRIPPNQSLQKELLIQNESREYTAEFSQLLRDYYLSH